MGNAGCLPRGKPASRGTQSTVHAGCFKCFYIPPNSDVDYGIFNVRTDVNTCDFTRGCTDTVKEPALEVDSRRKKSFAAPGNRTCVGDVRVSDAVPTELLPRPKHK